MTYLYKYLPQNIVAFLNQCTYINDVTEIKLRADNSMQLTAKGKLINIKNIFLSQKEIENIFYNMCNRSINAYEDEISNGFITLQGGYRVGIGGEYYYNQNIKKYILRQIASLNIRIPWDIEYFKNQENLFNQKPTGTLIIGPPHSGKTTLIKLYTKFLVQNYSVTVCDERKEIYTQNINCDILQGIQKSTAIFMATRTMNPQFIICDEIGTKQEAEEIMSAVNTGVEFICSAHGTSLQDIKKRPNIKLLTDSSVFKRYILLSAENNDFCIKEIINV